MRRRSARWGSRIRPRPAWSCTSSPAWSSSGSSGAERGWTTSGSRTSGRFSRGPRPGRRGGSAPRAVLREYGGFETAMMAGAMIGAARTGAVVLVDGFIASAAALAAAGLAPALRDYLVFAHRSAEPGHRAVLDAFGARPLLDLEMRLGEGTGALLAWPIPRVRGGYALRHGELRERGRERSGWMSRARQELALLRLAVQLLTGGGRGRRTSSRRRASRPRSVTTRSPAR